MPSIDGKLGLLISPAATPIRCLDRDEEKVPSYVQGLLVSFCFILGKKSLTKGCHGAGCYAGSASLCACSHAFLISDGFRNALNDLHRLSPKNSSASIYALCTSHDIAGPFGTGGICPLSRGQNVQHRQVATKTFGHNHGATNLASSHRFPKALKDSHPIWLTTQLMVC